MNGRIVLIAVLNALVAVALAALLIVLVSRAPEPPAADSAAADLDGNAAGAPERTEVVRTYPPQEQAARIKRDLMDRPDLIPFEGRLGGTMDFYDPDGIYVLSDRWVYARFDDGHVQGGMLLSYTLEADGSIAWEVLEARLE